MSPISFCNSALKVLALTLILATSSFAETKAENFKVGALLCLTGDCAEWGNNSLKGLQLAAEEINKTGGLLGRQIEIVAQDTREASGGGNSVSAYRQLTLDQEVNYIVGPTWTIGGLPLAPIAAQNRKIIMTSPSLGTILHA